MLAFRSRFAPVAVLAAAAFLLSYAILAKRSQYPHPPIPVHFGKALKYEEAVVLPNLLPVLETESPEFVEVGRVELPVLTGHARLETGAVSDGRAPPRFSSL